MAVALGQEIAALSAPGRLLLQGAAVAGDPAELSLAAVAGSVGDEAVAGALDELVASRLLGPSTLPRRYRFRHPIVRRVAYESAGEGWRLDAHARAAAALERRRRVARRARAPPRALRRARRRRRDRRARARPGTPRRRTRPPRPRAGTPPRCGCCPAERPAPAGVLAPAGHRAGLDGPARARAGALLEVLAAVPPELAELRARLVAACAACENLLGRHGDAHERLVQALAELPDRAGAAAAALEAELAADALYDSDFEALAAQSGRARAAAEARRRSRPARRGRRARLLRRTTAAATPTPAEAAQADAAAAFDAMDDGQLAGRLEAPYYLGFAEFLCERYDDVIRHAERGIAVSRASGQGQFIVPMMVGLAHALETRGRLAEALDTVEGAVEAGRLSGNRQVLSWALVGEGWVAASTGDLERGRARRRGGRHAARRAVGQHPHATPRTRWPRSSSSRRGDIERASARPPRRARPSSRRSSRAAPPGCSP